MKQFGRQMEMNMMCCMAMQMFIAFFRSLDNRQSFSSVNYTSAKGMMC